MMKKLFSTLVFTLAFAVNSFAATPKLDFTPIVQGNFQVQIDINTDLSDGAVLSASLSRHGLSDNDPFIGTDFVKITVNNNKASVFIDAEKNARPSVSAIMKGTYDLEVSFHPRWKENKTIADGLGVADTITVVKVIQLNGNGKGDEEFAKHKQELEGRAWVMGEVFQGMKWNEKFWQNKFGKPGVYNSTAGNPHVLKMYYFKKIDMTIMVNTLKQEIVTWRDGKASQ